MIVSLVFMMMQAYFSSQSRVSLFSWKTCFLLAQDYYYIKQENKLNRQRRICCVRNAPILSETC